MIKKLLSLSLPLFVFSAFASAEVTVPQIFGDNMVLQRDLADPIWGKASPGESVTVKIADQSKSVTADADGKWRVELDPMEAGGPYTLTISGTNTITIENVLVGEVWFCSGQSNMEFDVRNVDNAEVEIATANYPEIRFFTIKKKGTQELQYDVEGQWVVCSPETVKLFSAIGYFFGRRLNQTLDVPVGLVDNSWGGSAAEAWVPRDELEKDEHFADVLAEWDAKCDFSDEEMAQMKADFKAKKAEWVANGKKGDAPSAPRDQRYGQHRPANIYSGMVHPVEGYGIRGIIWYQGENNRTRAEAYRYLFPFMITKLRERWGQGDFPFYWVQLADIRAETDDPNQESEWATLREAQTMALSLPNTGQAVIIDVGEGRDIHPRNKQTPANRLTRWALAKDYGYDIDYQSPTFNSMTVKDNKAILTFDHVTKEGLRTFDTWTVQGFTIAGEDGQFHWANAKIIGKDKIEVWSDEVSNPVAVRYAWADNPVANVQDRNGLPLTPFRTDSD